MSPFRILILPFSWLYGLAILARNKCYDRGLLKTRTIGAPTVSIGNLRVGGTGKTPLVAYVARYFQQQGRKVAVLSRGYKREGNGFLLVSDGKKTLANPKESGDEPYELAQELPGVVVAVDRKRVRAGQYVHEQFAVEAFVLDDGFQHRPVNRNLDIVLLPVDKLGEKTRLSHFLSAQVLPAGMQREPLGSLRRAQHLVFTRAGVLRENVKGFEDLVKRYQPYTSADSSAIDYQVRMIIRLSDGKEEGIEDIRGKRVFLFCGVEDPESFRRLASDSGLMIVSRLFYPDHHNYTEKDFKNLRETYGTSRADLLLTTMKDSSRLLGSEGGKALLKGLPVHALVVDVHFLHGEKVFREHLEKLLS